MAEKHTILGGKVYVYQRTGSPVWQCSTYLDGKNRRVSTKEKSLSKAKEFAEDWYFQLRHMKSEGTLSSGPTFAQAAKRFVDEYEVMTEGERNPVYVQGHHGRIRNHLMPFFGKMSVKDITAGVVQDYRIFRLKNDPDFKVPSRSTMLHEIVTLRHVPRNLSGRITVFSRADIRQVIPQQPLCGWGGWLLHHPASRCAIVQLS